MDAICAELLLSGFKLQLILDVAYRISDGDSLYLLQQLQTASEIPASSSRVNDA